MTQMDINFYYVDLFSSFMMNQTRSYEDLFFYPLVGVFPFSIYGLSSLSFQFSCSYENTIDGNLRWCHTYILDPTDPLFNEIGEALITQ